MKNEDQKIFKLIKNDNGPGSEDATNPDVVLKNAIGEYESVMILGYKPDGSFDARASLNLNHEKILFLIEYFKHKLFKGVCYFLIQSVSNNCNQKLIFRQMKFLPCVSCTIYIK